MTFSRNTTRIFPRMRREMVDFGFLDRTNNGSEYWRTGKE